MLMTNGPNIQLKLETITAHIVAEISIIWFAWTMILLSPLGKRVVTVVFRPSNAILAVRDPIDIT